MLKIYFTLVSMLAFCGGFFAQSTTFQGKQIPKPDSSVLDDHFKNSYIFEIDAEAIYRYAKSKDEVSIKLNLGDTFSWEFDLWEHDIRSPNYVLRVATENGIVDLPRSENKVFRGIMKNGEGKVGLTLDTFFIYGTFRQGEDLFFIEPYRYLVPGAPRSQYVVYNGEDVYPMHEDFCAVGEMEDKMEEHLHEHGHQQTNESRSVLVGDCLELELAIASDWSMNNKYGGVAGVEGHNIGVMANVQTNYDDEFDDEIQFNIVTQFVSSCSTCDPWTSSTSITAVLNSFRNWAVGGGFGITHDLGQFWSNRNFQGPPVGVAYRPGLCIPNNRYHVIQDWTTNASLLRVTAAHEIGHNFNAVHDSGPNIWIMSPTVNNTTNWSSLSLSTINNYIANNTPCLSLCVPNQPPVADFSAIHINLCPGSPTVFYDQSTNDPIAWTWSFPGGTPSSSTQQNPTVTYNTPGTYPVTLTVTNAAGADSETKTNFITVGSGGQDMLLYNDFEQGLGTWSVVNPDNGITWMPESVSVARYGSGTASVENYIYGSPGQRDGLISPLIDLSGHANVQIQFDHAYCRRPGQPLNDSLIIYVSTDGGATFPNRVFAAAESGSGNFATRTALSSPFSPQSDNDWCYAGAGANCFMVDISQFGNMQNVVIKFENFTGNGNNIYLDNIRVLASCFVPPPVADFTATPPFGCVPLTVSFIDLSSNSPTSWDWQFEGGNPPMSTLQFPMVVYDQVGSFDVSLSVSNQGGSSSITKENFISVIDIPVAGFTYSGTDSVINFNNTSSGANSYTWLFGDGNTSTLANPTHTYQAPGIYQVDLVATNTCGSSTFTEFVVIVFPPVANFVADVTIGCNPLTVNFTDLSLYTPTSWNWSFPGGNPSSSTSQNPTVVYDQPGSYTVSLTVTNSAGTHTLTKPNLITVLESPVANFSFNQNGLAVNFDNQSSNSNSYEWNFGDSTSSNDPEPSHTYPIGGSYEVMLVSSNLCQSDTMTQMVVLGDPPDAAFTANPTSGCAPLSVQFTDLSLNDPEAWEWFFEGGTPSFSADQNPTVVYNQPGSYDVTLIVSNGLGSDTLVMEDFIQVNGPPTAGFSYTMDSLTVFFTNQSMDGDSYLWDFGDGNTSSQVSPSHTYDEDNFYTVTLYVFNNCGSDTISQGIIVTTPPQAGIEANTTSGCAPLTVAFSDLSSPNTTNWLWQFEGGMPVSSTQQNPTVTYNEAGSYDVTLIASNSAGADTLTFEDYIQVQGGPTAGFSSSVDSLTASFNNQSSNYDSLLWNFGDGNSSNQENPEHTYDSDGVYTVSLYAFNNCGVDTFVQNITIITPPQSGFSASVTFGCLPLTVAFTNNSSPNATSWFWEFEGGNPETSSAQNPVVMYNQSGTFDVTLVASNAAGSDTVAFEDYITVEEGPNAGFSAATNGLLASFTNQSTNYDSVRWHFGDGNTSTEENPDHIYDEDGVYSVFLLAFGNCGTDTSMQTITIVTPPTAGIGANVTTGCVPFIVNFTNQSSSNATSWEWTFQGGDPSSSTEQNPSVTYNQAGIFDVTLIVSNAAGSDTITSLAYVTAEDGPAAGFSSNIDSLSANFTNQSSNFDSVQWNFGDGNTSTEENPVHTYDEDGEYTVTMVAFNNCGTDTSVQTVTIITPPSAGFSSSATTGCIPFTVNFTDESSSNATSWEWTFEGGEPSSSTDQNPEVTYNQAGVFDVTLVVTNAAGSDTITSQAYIAAGEKPTADFSTNTDSLSANFTNQSSNFDSVQWNFGDGNSSAEENPQHTYDEDGEYTVTMVAFNDCGTDTSIQTITIITPPSAGIGADITQGCVPFTVNFTDESSSNATSWEWTFEGADPSSSTEQNPVVTYNQAGTFDVILIASNAAGSDTLTFETYVSAEDIPSADFTATTNGGVATFANESQNASSYLWDFGDGDTSITENPTHEYDQDGNYTVTLIAVNDCGSDTTTKEITITTPLVAGFGANNTIGCVPFTVQFEDQSSNNVVIWQWSFPGGEPATSNQVNPEVVYNQPGTYDVTLTVMDVFGNSSTVTQTGFIVVGEEPTADFTSTGPGLDIQFDNTSIGGNTYQWDFGDGNTSQESDPVHTYDEGGTYMVELIVTNSCGSDTVVNSVDVLGIPVPSFKVDNAVGCAPYTVNFLDLSFEQITEWHWEFPGGNPSSSTEQNPVVSYANPGVYDVTLKVVNAAGTDSITEMQYITVLPGPTAGFSSNVTMAEANFSNESSEAESYFWNFGDDSTSVEENPVHTYQAPGEYDVMLVATNDCGSDTLIQTLVISVESFLPVVAMEALPTEGCPTLEVQFTDLSSNNPTEWEWTFEGGNPAMSPEQNPVVNYSTPGTFDVELIVWNTYGSDTLVFENYIVVDSLPQAGFTFTIVNGQATFMNTSTNSNSYFWLFGDDSTSAGENPVHEYLANDSYPVTLIATNDCGSDTITQTVDIITSTILPEEVDELIVFPNPNDGTFSLRMSGKPVSEVQLSLIDVLGRYLYGEKLDFSSGFLEKTFTFEQWSSGTYILRLEVANRFVYRKVVIER